MYYANIPCENQCARRDSINQINHNYTNTTAIELIQHQSVTWCCVVRLTFTARLLVFDHHSPPLSNRWKPFSIFPVASPHGISTSTKRKGFIVYATRLFRSVFRPLREGTIPSSVHTWCRSYVSTSPRSMTTFMNWLVRILVGRPVK